MNKRGQAEAEELLLFIEIVLGILVAGIFIYSATNFDAFSTVNQVYAEEDLTLLFETALAAPGSLEYDYQLKNIYAVRLYTDELDVTKSDGTIDSYTYYNISISKEEGKHSLTLTENV